MRTEFPLFPGIALQIASDRSSNGYPTARIQKGLILVLKGQELCDEGVGFGVPIIKRGLRTIFPGEIEIISVEGDLSNGIYATYKMNLEEKLTKPGAVTINNSLLYKGKNILAAMIRQFPFLRGMLTRTSSMIRSSFAWETTYVPTEFSTDITMNYQVDAENGRIIIEYVGQEMKSDDITEVIVMNEQGANHFDLYQDTDGLSISGDKISCWDPVLAKEASFISLHHKISFSLSQVNGARLYRGRELIGKRLAWAGFGYSFPARLGHFIYSIAIKRIP